ncbi:hypothetical protein J2T08_004051 [Neorhizobium galegae]|uniref:hypothetical protein n=1 Tax=Neorhizobium galegae TaxID=399 RepID=UPI002787D9C0|nr:hypothetical protein [Neorhizobium galegae]MDQ0136130.1 hypothetical protein [Neorhizobium galegae]
MDEMLARSLPRAEKLRSGGLGFQQKISVLNAAWQGDPESGDNLAKALVRFNDLRNSVAHGDSKKEVAASHKNLIKAVAQIDPNQREAPSPYELAISICGFMGDDPGGAAALRQMRQIDDLVNELLPELFRRPVKDASA